MTLAASALVGVVETRNGRVKVSVAADTDGRRWVAIDVDCPHGIAFLEPDAAIRVSDLVRKAWGHVAPEVEVIG